MKLCKRAVEFFQIINDYGDVRQCGWLCDGGGVIGRLLDDDFETIFHSKKAKKIREKLSNHDFSNCNPNACPYVACGTVSDVEIEIDELPRYPESIRLAYENVCNYKCIMCNIPGCLSKADMEERERRLEIIDNKLREILPYVKNIGANGLGELFASKHTMQLLSEWKPLADPTEIEVHLETNGSLFNAQNWKKISNLGNYKLSVSITVLSFDKEIYKEMSGTGLSVDNIVNNLYYVKSLREEGIIDYLEIATVVQEKNFREMPEFARRCVEEFGADYVRLRPYEPWGGEGFKEWFKDVRNEFHPFYNEYKEIMNHPNLKNPKVHDWSGGRKSGLGPEPYPKMKIRYALIEKLLDESFMKEKLNKIITPNEKIVIYGIAQVGKTIVQCISDEYNVKYIIDKSKPFPTYKGISCISLDEIKDMEKDVLVIISLERNEDIIKKQLNEMGYRKVVGIRELLDIV